MNCINKFDVGHIKAQASGRWSEIFSRLGGVSLDILDGKNHPCPKCGGSDRFRMIDPDAGALLCNQCFATKNGDGLAAIKWLTGCTFPKALQKVAEYLGIIPTEHSTQPDLIEAICRDKRMPIEAFRRFNPEVATRGRSRNQVVRVPVYDEHGKQHSHFDLAVAGKGWFARGKGMAGMFFPGRLPQPGEVWLVVEGVKDSSALIGLGFNSCGLPNSNLASKYARLFSGVDVVLIPDLDSAGQTGSQLSGGRLAGIANSIRIARLPGEIVESGGADVRDVLRLVDGEQLVREAIEVAESWKPRPGELQRDGRPEVLVTLDEAGVADSVVTALGSLVDDQTVYCRGGVLVHAIESEDSADKGRLMIRKLPISILRERVTQACQLKTEKEDKDGEVKTSLVQPPKWLIDSISDRGYFASKIKHLAGVTESPTLRADGSILQVPGYDQSSGLIFRPNAKFPTVHGNPTVDDAKFAIDQLAEVVTDFPFQDGSDRVCWLALVLSLIGRQSIPGCVPLFAITSTTRGSGKSLLADAASLIAFGRCAARKTFTKHDEEMRKSITSIAIEACPSVLLDNVDQELGGSNLDSAITSGFWTDRILGMSRTTGDLPMRTVWIATGNNLRFGSDLARRVLPIRLIPEVENPEERTDFQQTDLLGWVRENRPRLAIAALTILRAYFVAGCPVQVGKAFGSFEDWSAIIRGSLLWLGEPDPCDTRESAKSDDNSSATVRGLIGGLLEVTSDVAGMTIREILGVLSKSDDATYPTMREVISDVATYKGAIDAKRLGYVLRKFKGRIANNWKIVGETSHGGIIKWNAKKVSRGDGWDIGDVLSDSMSKTCVSQDTLKGDTCDTRISYGDPVKGIPLSQPSPTKVVCETCTWSETTEAGWIKTSCSVCGRFYGRRPATKVKK